MTTVSPAARAIRQQGDTGQNFGLGDGAGLHADLRVLGKPVQHGGCRRFTGALAERHRQGFHLQARKPAIHALGKTDLPRLHRGRRSANSPQEASHSVISFGTIPSRTDNNKIKAREHDFSNDPWWVGSLYSCLEVLQ